MKRALPVCLCILFACAQKTTTFDVNYPPIILGIKPNTKNVITVIGYYGQGHACPVDGKVLSARHIVEITWPSGMSSMTYFMWEDGNGNDGWGMGLYSDNYQDLGLMSLTGKPEYYSIGPTPIPGEKVWWVEFQEGANNAFLDVEKSSEVLHLRAGHIVFKDAPNPGASGSCLLNQWGQVVGIVVWRINIRGESTGVAVAVPPPAE